MKILVNVYLLFFLLVTAGCGDVTSVQSTEVREQAGDELLARLGKSLASDGKTARVYFYGDCNLGSWGELLFPSVKTTNVVNGSTGVEQVREMFRDDRNVTVTEDSSGLIRIKIGAVSGEILTTTVRSITFNQVAQYNPDGPGGAISAIENTPEVRANMSTLKVSQSPVYYIGQIAPVIETHPHLATSIENTTVEQLLDSIATTFRGVVVYGECKRPSGEGLIDIDFMPLPHS